MTPVSIGCHPTQRWHNHDVRDDDVRKAAGRPKCYPAVAFTVLKQSLAARPETYGSTGSGRPVLQQHQADLLRRHLPLHPPVVQVVVQLPVADAELELLSPDDDRNPLNTGTAKCRAAAVLMTSDSVPACQPQCCSLHAA